MLGDQYLTENREANEGSEAPVMINQDQSEDQVSDNDEIEDNMDQ